MRFLLAIATCFIVAPVFAQPYEKYATDAFVVMRMAQVMHVQPKPVDTDFSVSFFDNFFKELDEHRLFFTAEDMDRLSAYRTTLADEVKTQKTNFLKQVTGIYEQRIRYVDSLLARMLLQPFNFTINEKLTVAEDSLYPQGPQAQQQKLAKLLKKEVLGFLFERVDHIEPAKLKIVADSLEPTARKKIINAFQRSIKRMRERTGGIVVSLGNLYCESLASTFDPHSSYMPKDEKEDFESQIGNKSMRFGFSLDWDEDDETVSIKEMRPGSPAYKSGMLNKGDKIMSVQWEGKGEIDMSEAGPQEVSEALGENNTGKMVLTVQKADGLMKKVELVKEAMEMDEDALKVKSFVLVNGNKSIGYLSLPAFYTDFDDPQNNVKGCANDVAKAVLQLKKENISGLILDLRYNGGGSMLEAVDLSGIFIDAGPVGQVGSSGGKIYPLKDANRGTIYSGPLLLLVNGASASASEMVAGTLQDYHRAIIMGTPTFGKATSQVIVPLDSTKKTPGSNPNAQTFLKITIGKLYRITGSSAQGNGVIPDIQLPDITETIMPRESANPGSLKLAAIAANKFYTPYAADSISHFMYGGRSIIDTSAWYVQMKKNTASMRELMRKTDISLRWQDAWQQWEKQKSLMESLEDDEYDNNGMFNVQSPVSEEARIKLSQSTKEMYEQWKESILKDAWIAAAFKVLSISK